MPRHDDATRHVCCPPPPPRPSQAIHSLGIVEAFTDSADLRGLSDAPLLVTDIQQTVSRPGDLHRSATAC